MQPKFPSAHVQLVGRNGNAFTIIGLVKDAMKQAGCSDDDFAAYYTDAVSGDYNHLLQVTMQTVDVS